MNATENHNPSQPLAVPLQRPVRPLPPAWRLIVRANPFVPWILLEHCACLEDACRKAAQWKARGKFYAVHVRAN